ncbi:hypothetical protein FACS189493_7230 [Spirochaetia bacterium]|nr:hypothetical protein FACS189493_7230 [Spirochaetia bacterium]
MDDMEKTPKTADSVNGSPASAGQQQPDTPDSGFANRHENSDPVFYYNRERRLARASPDVRALYEGGGSRSSLFRGKTGSVSQLLVLIPIIIMLVFMLIVSRTSREPGGASLGGNTVTVTAMGFSDATYVVVKKKALKDDAYTGNVDIAASIAKKGGDTTEVPIETRRIFFTLETAEEFRFSLPFGAPDILMVFNAGEEFVSLRVKPE